MSSTQLPVVPAGKGSGKGLSAKAASRRSQCTHSPTKERVWREKGSAQGTATTKPDYDCTIDDASTEAGDGTPQVSPSGGDQATPGVVRTPPSTKPPPAKRPLVSYKGADNESAAPAVAPAAEQAPSAGPAPADAAAGIDPTEARRARSDQEVARKAEALQLTEEQLMEKGLGKLLSQMAAMSVPSTRKTPFECKFPPGISIQDYVARVVRFSCCHSTCVVMSLVYLDRLIKRHPLVTVGPLTCHRLVLTTIVLAIKFYDDTYYSNAFYGKVGGIQLKELNALERVLLKLIDFKLSVDPQEFELYRGILLKAVSIGEEPEAA